jgi:tartrate/fumarate subfamily iron-sulfur-dependent hydro-lyase alpha chain
VNFLIKQNLIKKTTFEALKKAAIFLPKDVKKALKDAYARETNEIAKLHFKALLKNIRMAERKGLPVCGDTGLPLFYIKLGDDVDIQAGFSSLEPILKEATRIATKEIPLRQKAVHPITRENPGTNIGANIPQITYKIVNGDFLDLIVVLKGGGAEKGLYCIRFHPFTKEYIKTIKKTVLDAVIDGNVGGLACPPNIIGIGVGGTFDLCTKLAREAAVLRLVSERHREEIVANLEKELIEIINSFGIGFMGMGGSTSVLDVHIEIAYCSSAQVPIAVNAQCAAARRTVARIFNDGTVEWRENPEWF